MTNIPILSYIHALLLPSDPQPVEVQGLVLVHPDLSHAGRVDPVGVVGDEVRVERTEDVTDVAGE